MNARRIGVARICASLIFMLLFAASDYAEIDQGTIVAAWLFDEGSGDTAKDFSGNGHDGEVVGGPDWVDGKFGKALEFDGIDDWVEVEEIGTFDEITICVWAKYTGKVGQFRVIFNNNGWVVGDLHYQIRVPNELNLAVNGDGGHLFSEIFFNDKEMDKWHHFASSYSATGDFRRHHINGEPDASDEKPLNPVKIGPARIGAWDGGVGIREWQGMLDELIIFNAILDQEDIQAIMNDGIETVLSVEPIGKLATSWGDIKAGY